MNNPLDLTAEELRREARFIARLKENTRFGQVAGGAITYYLDKNKTEIGYIAWPGTTAETVVTFSPPRVWHWSTLDRYELTPINGE